MSVLFIALIKSQINWIKSANWHNYLALSIMGFFIAVFVEYKAFVFEQWYYLDPIPILPFFEVGLSPFLQMVILLHISVYITRIIANILNLKNI